MMDLKNIIDEVMTVLKSLGYKNVQLYNPDDYDITFNISGFEDFPQRHKDMISLLLKGYLKEMYYAPGGIQHIYIYNDLKGVEPDDDRYSCLISKIIHVQTPPPELFAEAFINYGDCCARTFFPKN